MRLLRLSKYSDSKMWIGSMLSEYSNAIEIHKCMAFFRRETAALELNSWSTDCKVPLHLHRTFYIEFTGHWKLQFHTSRPLTCCDCQTEKPFSWTSWSWQEIMIKSGIRVQKPVSYIHRAPRILLSLNQLNIGTGSWSLALQLLTFRPYYSFYKHAING